MKKPTTFKEAAKEINKLIKKHPELKGAYIPVVWYPIDTKSNV